MMLGEREGSVDDGMDNPLFGGSPRMRNDGDVENANGLRKRTSSSTALTSLDDPSLTIGLLEDSYEDEQSKVNKLYMFLFAGGVIMQGVLFLSLWCAIASARAEGQSAQLLLSRSAEPL